MKARMIFGRIVCVCFFVFGAAMLCGSYAEAAEVKITTKGKLEYVATEYIEFQIEVKNVTSPTSVIKISSSRPMDVECNGDIPFTVSKKTREIPIEKILKEYGWEEGKPLDDYLGKIGKIYFDLSKEADVGNTIFNIAVEDGGKTLIKKKYKFQVAKIVNPFKKFIVGNRNLTKKFDKRIEASDINGSQSGITQKDRSVLYGGGKPYSIVLKKGYKLTGIWYVKHKYTATGEQEKDRKEHKWKNRKKLPPLGHLIVKYKDKQGKKAERSIHLYEVAG